MENESFETTMIADILNRFFISIKVDREERPDVDSVYMSVCQILTGSGGWPLTILMTPDQKPFFAGTYFPKQSSYGRIGLFELLMKISDFWNNNRIPLLNSSKEIYSFITAQQDEPLRSHTPDKTILTNALSQFTNYYDKKYGGFSPPPKFPTPHNLIFLLRYGTLEDNRTAIEMASETLIKMYQGGIYDHIGGGFSRYSTDEKWLVPHFEKMLYDNALLIIAYTEGYKTTKNKLFEKAVHETISYVLSELKDSDNGFYCGQDADSDGEEGKYYTFSKEEILDVLGSNIGEKFCEWYHITKEGNFEGKNIANLIEKPRYFMGTYKQDKDISLHETHPEDEDIKSAKKKLYEYRKGRTYLHKDDKQLTSWNAMMISALTRASHVFDNNLYLDAAEKAQGFIDKNLTREGTKLFVRYKDGDVANNGLLDDYAYYTWALIELYETCFDISYLEKAVLLTDYMIDHFWDSKKYGFFLYSKESEKLITRPKETYDGAIPSGNSVASYVLARLYKLTAEIKWKDYLDKQLIFICRYAYNQSVSHSFALLSMLEIFYPSIEIICVGDNENEQSYLVQLLKTMYPVHLNILIKTHDNEKALAKIAPFTNNYNIPEGQNKYYVCENGVCKAPYNNEKDVLDHFRSKLLSC